MTAGFDCAMPVRNPERLRAAGYSCAIRYYSEHYPSKALTKAETETLCLADFDLMAVYQDVNNHIRYFSDGYGYAQGRHAYSYGHNVVKQPAGSAIYFAVDVDATSGQINDVITAYFSGIRRAFDELSGGQPDYAIGVYGSGLVCQRLLDAKLVEFAWLAGAKGWQGYQAFDQSGGWAVKQILTVQGDQIGEWVCGTWIDRDELNPAFESVGQFRVPVARRSATAAAEEWRSMEIIARPGLKLRGGPGTSFDVLGLLRAGQVIQAGPDQDGWVQVDLEGDRLADGYCSSAFLRTV